MLRSLRIILLIIAVVMIALNTSDNLRAQTSASSPTTTLQFVYWPTTVTGTIQSGTATWTTSLYGLDLRLDWPSKWGLHLNGATGSEAAWVIRGTSLSGVPVSGADTIWSGDLTYEWASTGLAAGTLTTGHVFVGYGGRNLNFSTSGLGSLTGSSSGVRIGADADIPFAAPWAVRLGFAYEPSDTMTGSVFNALGTGASGSASVNGSGADYFASIRYTTPTLWVIEGGYRWSRNDLQSLVVAGTAVCPCAVVWSGPYLSIGKTFGGGTVAAQPTSPGPVTPGPAGAPGMPTPIGAVPMRPRITYTVQQVGQQAQVTLQIMLPAGEDQQPVRVDATDAGGVPAIVYEGIGAPGDTVSATTKGLLPLTVRVYASGTLVKQISIVVP